MSEAMIKMKTLTINGTTFEVVDEEARNNIDAKQSIIDETLKTTNKTIPGAINEIYEGRIDQVQIENAVNDALTQAKENGDFKGETGAKGDTGDKGETGIGIKSIDQTTTSTADDGNNVITITMTDGTKHTFVVQNGSKGSTGPKGDTGDKGSDYVLTNADKVEMANLAVTQAKENGDLCAVQIISWEEHD